MLKKILLIVAILFIWNSLVFSQQKIGFIISEQIIAQYPESIKVKKILDELQKKALDSIGDIQKEYETKMNDYRQKESLMTEDGKKKAQQEIVDLQEKYRIFSQRKSDELKTEYNRLMQPIMDDIQNVLDAVAKEEKLSFVFDKTQSAPVLLYGDNQFNITNKVLDVLIRGGSKKKNK